MEAPTTTLSALAGAGDGGSAVSPVEEAVGAAAASGAGAGGGEAAAEAEAEAATAEGRAGAEAAEVEGDGAAKPKSPVVMAMMHYKWASFLQKAGQHEKAAEHFAKSAAQCRNPRALFGLGTCLARLRRRAAAEEALAEACRLAPTMVGARVNLASVLLARGAYEEAVVHLELALAVEPGSREAVMNLANVLRNLGRREEAIDLVWRYIAAEEQRLPPPPPPALFGGGREGDEKPPLVDAPAVADVQERPSTSLAESPPAEADAPAASAASAQAAIECETWRPAALDHAGPPLAVVCVKWGDRYGAEYVNRLHAGARRHLRGRLFDFVCFTDVADGLDAAVEARPLPSGLPLWWGKAYLFSKEAGLDGRRVLFLDLDQVVVGSLDEIAAYAGPFAVLGTDDIACELANGGYNSSVMAWDASPYFRPVHSRLTAAVLKFVHRFDHWLEMTVRHADLWQALLPGHVVDYTAAFRGGVCLGSAEEEEASASECLCTSTFAFAPADSADGDGLVVDSAGASQGTMARPPTATTSGAAAAGAHEPAPPAAVVTFPRSPKPHEVVELHAWVRKHWLGDPS